MAETHVISALVDKRGRIDGEIQARRYQIMRLELELAHVDAVIKMFRPNYDIDKIATKRSFAKNPAGVPKSSGGRHALSILREAGAPLTANEIAGRVLAKLKKEDTSESRKMLACTIVSTLSRRKDGAVVFDTSTVPGRWSLRQHDSRSV
ncbi:MAG: hypothetical protein ABI395_01735 [Sphingobium sp.]